MGKNQNITTSAPFWEKVLRWGIAGIFAIMPLLYWGGRIAATVTSKQYFFIGSIDVLIIVWVWVMLNNVSYRPTKKDLIYIVPVVLFIASMVVSTFLGVDRTTSLFSTIERGGGLVFNIHAAVLAVMTVTITRVNKAGFLRVISQAILFSATIIAIVTFFTKEAFDIGALWLNESAGGAMLGNSTIAGAYFVFALFLGLTLLLGSRSVRDKCLYGVGMIVIMFSPILFNVKALVSGALFSQIITNPFVVIGQARAAVGSIVLGGVIAILCYLVFSSRKKIVKWVGIVGVFSIVVLTMFVAVQIFQTNSRIQNLFISQVGQNRLIFWDEAFKGFKERPIIGWGPENYKVVHQKYFNPLLADAAHGSETWVDKPHNSTIELLVSQGAMGLMFYVFLIGTVIYILIRSIISGAIDEKTGSILTGMIVAYVVQNQFAFDSITSTAVFFAMVGVIIGLYSKNREDGSDGKSFSLDQKRLILGILVVVIVPVWVYAAYLPTRKTVQAKKIFDESVVIRTPKYEDLFSGPGSYAINTDLGMIYYTLAEAYLAQRGMIQTAPQLIEQVVPELKALIKAGEDNMKYAKNDYRFMLAMSIFQETEIGLVGRYSQEQIDRLNNYITQAIALSPTNPFSYLVYNKILLYSENIDEARRVVDYAIALNPAIKESHDQKIGFENVFGTKKQQADALRAAQIAIPGYVYR